MTQPNNSNPFMFPGLGQPGDAGQNPMLASIEMMRQAWQNLAQAGAPHGLGLATPPMSIEELDRRIAELRTVENWLRMNLSMLTSTIQGLEVQRATISTLKSFVSSEGLSGNGDNPSALEVALGLKPSGQAKIKPARTTAGKGADTSEAPEPPPSQGATDAANALKQGSEAMQQGSDAAQAWWSMLQNQFNTLASATSAAMPEASAAGKASGAAHKTAAGSATSANASSTMSAASAPKRTAAARARKQTAATVRKKSSARKTAVRKRSTTKKAAG